MSDFDLTDNATTSQLGDTTHPAVVDSSGQPEKGATTPSTSELPVNPPTEVPLAVEMPAPEKEKAPARRPKAAAPRKPAAKKASPRKTKAAKPVVTKSRTPKAAVAKKAVSAKAAAPKKKTSAKATPVKKTPVKKATAKTAAVKKAAVKKTTVKTSAVKKTRPRKAKSVKAMVAPSQVALTTAHALPPTHAKAASHEVVHEAVKGKAKLVRDSFTMPQQDFGLIAVLKERALGFKRPAKKSELLRAGLHALQQLADTQLRGALDSLAPLKAGRPKKKPN